nr:hypothetical protein [Methylomarinum sp. Ch1-1]MDP4521080.1 hypothetical protein [Methylomarinum sp. Ch1-1]
MRDIIEYRILDKEVLDSSLLISVHRNPIDRAISIYKYWGFNRKMNFDEFCKKIIKNPSNVLNRFDQLMHLKPQVSFVKNSGEYEKKIFWLSFENLYEDLLNLISSRKIDIKIENKKTNKSIEKKLRYLSSQKK